MESRNGGHGASRGRREDESAEAEQQLNWKGRNANADIQSGKRGCKKTMFLVFARTAVPLSSPTSGRTLSQEGCRPLAKLLVPVQCRWDVRGIVECGRAGVGG